MITESKNVPGTGVRRQLLFSTNNRSFQQTREQKQRSIEAKYKLKGKKFHTRKTPPRFCKSKKYFLLIIEDGKLRRVIVSRIGCNSWTCPDCQKTKALKLKYYLLDVARLNQISYHLVLTLDPKVIPSEYLSEDINNTHSYITKLFNHFITILKRNRYSYFNKKKKKYFTFELSKQSTTLKYLWVLQFQPNTGNAHLHILLNQFLPAEIIRKVWIYVGGGHDLKIENVKTVEGVSRYITDYIVDGLDPEKSHPLGGFKYFERRYSVSKSCIKPPKKSRRIFEGLSPDELKKKLVDHKLGFVFDELENSNSPDLDITFKTDDSRES